MLKRFCNKCGKELDEDWNMFIHLQKNKLAKETHASVMNQIDLCEDCHDYVVHRFNELLKELKAEERFVERA